MVYSTGAPSSILFNECHKTHLKSVIFATKLCTLGVES